MAEADQVNLTTLTVELLSAYVSNNTVTDGNLPALIQSTHSALKSIHAPEPESPAEPEHVPAVSARKSLASRTHIISMIDGKPYQTLKRHLSRHGLTPDEYRSRYALPKTYPMVAPAYSESRRAIAQKLGLGRKAKAAEQSGTAAVAATESKAAQAPVAEAEAVTKAKRGRKPNKAQAAPTESAAVEAAPTPTVKAPRGRKAAAPAAKGAAPKKVPTPRAKKAAPIEPTPAKPARAKRGAAKPAAEPAEA